jgi:hypothetical protein
LFSVSTFETYVLFICLKRMQTDEYADLIVEKAFIDICLAQAIAGQGVLQGMRPGGVRVRHVNSLDVEHNTTLLIAGKNPYKPAGD